MIQVEICTPSRQSAVAAKEGGAQRIELCRDLPCGGLTPTAEDVEYCVHELGLRTHVLVRPRAGDFCYTSAEVDEIERSILCFKKLGAHAVVVGFLTADGCVDEVLTRRMVQLATPMEVTFHRAFDEARQDPLEAMQVIAACGCRRLLTSGQASTAIAGADVIKKLVSAASEFSRLNSQFSILAGSGVTPTNVCELIKKTGVGEVHGSCKTVLHDGTVQTDAAQVKQLLASIAEL